MLETQIARRYSETPEQFTVRLTASVSSHYAQDALVAQDFFGLWGADQQSREEQSREDWLGDRLVWIYLLKGHKIA